MEDLKQCHKCKEMLNKSMFVVCNKNKDKLKTWCKKCTRLKYLENKERHLTYNKNWREQNPGYWKKYITEDAKKYKRKYNKTHKEELRKKAQERRKNFPQIEAAMRKKYVETHKEHLREYMNNWHRKKRATDPQYVLKQNVSRRIRQKLNIFLKNKTKRTCEYLGCDIAFLKTYLESKFDVGMSWQSYGKIWHIDHIIPCNTWDQTNTFETYCCWNYRNLQPMYAYENYSKRDKYDESKKMIYIERMKILIA